MELKILIANIIVAIPYAILITYTFLNTKRKTIMICCVIANVIFTIQFLILEAYTGALVCLYSTVMYFLFYLKGRNKLFSTWFIPILCAIIYLLIGIFTYDSLLSIIPTICALITVFTMWLDKEFVIKVFNIPISILWIIYNVIFSQYIGTIGQIILLIIDIVYIILYFKKYRYIK